MYDLQKITAISFWEIRIEQMNLIFIPCSPTLQILLVQTLALTEVLPTPYPTFCWLSLQA